MKVNATIAVGIDGLPAVLEGQPGKQRDGSWKGLDGYSSPPVLAGTFVEYVFQLLVVAPETPLFDRLPDP